MAGGVSKRDVDSVFADHYVIADDWIDFYSADDQLDQRTRAGLVTAMKRMEPPSHPVQSAGAGRSSKKAWWRVERTNGDVDSVFADDHRLVGDWIESQIQRGGSAMPQSGRGGQHGARRATNPLNG